MKLIMAIIRPEQLSPVKTALEEIGIMAMTITQVHGRGEQKGLEFTHRAGKYRVDLLSKTKIEVVVKDDQEQKVIDVICASARTGEIGDGKIFVIPVDRTVKVRTGEMEK